MPMTKLCLSYVYDSALRDAYFLVLSLCKLFNMSVMSVDLQGELCAVLATCQSDKMSTANNRENILSLGK